MGLEFIGTGFRGFRIEGICLECLGFRISEPHTAYSLGLPGVPGPRAHGAYCMFIGRLLGRQGRYEGLI